MPDDSLFLAELRAGDSAAFERLVRTEGPAMFAVIRRLVREEEDARDVLQEAFIQVARGLPTFRGDAALSSWLHRIARNAALMHLRRPRRRHEVPIEDFLPRFDESGHHVDPIRELPAPPDAPLLGRELRERVRAAVDRLPDSYRSVLVLRDLEEMSTAETAVELGLTETAVRVRLHRARLALESILRRVMAPDGGDAEGDPDRDVPPNAG